MHLQGQYDKVCSRGERGYAMVALLVGMSIMAVMFTVAMPVWKQDARREKEAELIFRGQQYARAIGLFQRKNANAFPPSIDVLLAQRFLRKKYKDPITGEDFLPVTRTTTPAPGTGAPNRPGLAATPGSPRAAASPPGVGSPAAGGSPGPLQPGGIAGVSSRSKAQSIRVYNGRTHYNEWQFVYTPQTQQPGAPGGAVAPGQPRPGNPNAPPIGRPGGGRPGLPPGIPPRRPPGGPQA
jgi:type II secretory pathway pseudopilin PulG